MSSIDAAVKETDIGRDQRVTILVAEDDPLVSETIHTILKQHNFRAHLAKSASEALQFLSNHGHIDLLITDFVMPGGETGKALADQLRRQTPDLPVVFISGFPPAALAFCHGVSDREIRIMKPFTKASLLAAIDELIG